MLKRVFADKKCPKCGSDSAGADTCPACGLIFAKYLKTKFAVPQLEAEEQDRLLPRAKELLFHIPERVDPPVLYGCALLLAVIAFYGVKLALMDIPSWEMSSSLIHLPMVPIHEFGHVLFRPFGEFMTLLGGSLFQIVLPLIFGGVFLVKNRDPFAASGLLHKAQPIGRGTHAFGVLTMLVALAWGAWLVWHQYRRK